MQVFLTKTMIGLIPADERSREWFDNVKLGEAVHADFKRVRNYAFHRKYFALLNLAYEYWEPGEIGSQYGKPLKSFERFRRDLQILAGRFNVVIRLDGSTRIESDSISFSQMSQEEFEKLYNDVLTVIMEKILINMEKNEIDSLVDKFLQFA